MKLPQINQLLHAIAIICTLALAGPAAGLKIPALLLPVIAAIGVAAAKASPGLKDNAPTK